MNAVNDALEAIRNAIASGSHTHLQSTSLLVNRICGKTSDPATTKQQILDLLSQVEREKFSALMPEDQKTKPTPQPEPPKDIKQVVLDGQLYVTQTDIWQNKIFAVGDRVVSLIPGEVGRLGTVTEINRVSPERIAAYDDLIVIWDNNQRDCLYFNQVGKKA